jgi:hypothetical protein
MSVQDEDVQIAQLTEQVRQLTEQRDMAVSDLEEMKSVIAENWNMQDILRQILKGRPGGVYFNKWEPVILKALNELPATYAILSSLRAEGVNFAASRLAAAYNHGFIDKPMAEVGDVVRMILTAKEDLANNPAADDLSGEYAENALAEWVAQLRLHSASSQAPLSAAITNIITERQRQQTAEGWTPEHDDQHVNFEMAIAGGLYAIAAVDSHPQLHNTAPSMWPWDREWWKPTNPRRDLVKAAALIAAEIERIDRAATNPGEDE